jgi:hypothetical protein
MTLLNPTPEELAKAHQARLVELELRAQRYRERRSRFVRRMTIAGALLLPISARMAAFGGAISWLGILLLGLVGAWLGWIIARYALGILRGMLLFGFGSFAAWLPCYLLGWWKGVQGGDFISGAGMVTMMVVGWLAWAMIGAVMGMISGQFDNDNVQI